MKLIKVSKMYGARDTEDKKIDIFKYIKTKHFLL